MEIVNYIILGISFLGYIIVYRIQKSLYTKQNDIMNSYKEVLKIMNIDEIKKHVELREENIELKFGNQLLTMEQELEKSKLFLLESKQFNEETKQSKDKLKILLDDNVTLRSSINNIKIIDEQFLKLVDDEFDEIYNFITSELKSSNEFKGLFFEVKVMEISSKYLKAKRELLINRTRLN